MADAEDAQLEEISSGLDALTEKINLAERLSPAKLGKVADDAAARSSQGLSGVIGGSIGAGLGLTVAVMIAPVSLVAATATPLLCLALGASTGVSY